MTSSHETVARSASGSGKQEPWNAELIRIARGYWRHSPAGMPVPGFLSEHALSIGAVPTSVRARFLGNSVYLRYGTFALELEHRAQPIVTQAGLTAVIRRIVSGGYDLLPAQRLADQFSMAREVHNTGCEPGPNGMQEDDRAGEGNTVHRRQRDSVLPDLRQYPAGFQANMAVIRRLLATR